MQWHTSYTLSRRIAIHKGTVIGYLSRREIADRCSAKMTFSCPARRPGRHSKHSYDIIHESSSESGSHAYNTLVENYLQYERHMTIRIPNDSL